MASCAPSGREGWLGGRGRMAQGRVLCILCSEQMSPPTRSGRGQGPGSTKGSPSSSCP